MLTDIGPGRFWLGQMRSTLRAQGYSVNTVDAYLYWAEAFVDHFHGQIPAQLGPEHLDQFLDPGSAAAPKTRLKRYIAIKAVEFLVEEVAGRELPWLEKYVKSQSDLKQLDYLKRGSIKQILDQLDGWAWLAAAVSYGCGLTLDECLRLRLRDMEITSRLLSIRDADEAAIRRTADLPVSLLGPMECHVDTLRAAHIQRFAGGSLGVVLPPRIRRENPAAARSWQWQFLFPEYLVRETPTGHDWPMPSIPVQHLIKALNQAAVEACQAFQFSSLSLRNSFALHRIQDGHTPESIRRLLGIASGSAPGVPGDESVVA